MSPMIKAQSIAKKGTWLGMHFAASIPTRANKDDAHAYLDTDGLKKVAMLDREGLSIIKLHSVAL